MGQSTQRHIGQILVDGKFLSQHDLDGALEEQKRSKELLGRVLVRMGVLKDEDIAVPLRIQADLGSLEDAVKIAAGERQLLGALLVQSGQITSEQLDYAITEQKQCGEQLGEVFIRLGMLTKGQLLALLEFQHQQECDHPSPLKLGELLVATGHLTRTQLAAALAQQTVSHKKLGLVLVGAGYVSPQRIRQGIRLQKMLLKAVLAAILSLGMSSVGSAASVNLQWEPNPETNAAGYKVYHGADAAQLAASTPLDVQKEISATVDGLDPDTTYTFAVTAYDADGQESAFSNIVTVTEQAPPTVVITAPATTTNVSGTVSITVDAADNAGVTKVEYYVNDQLMATDTAAPYVHSWNTAALPTGSYTLLAKAYDAHGNIGQSAASTVTVVNDTSAPTVAVVSPGNNAVLSGVVAINANAADNVGVRMVELYANGALIFASNAAPYSFNWDTRSVQNGIYTLLAKATDGTGNVSQSSAISVTVNNAVPDTTAPTMTAFALPATATAKTVSITMLTAADNLAVSGYLITESAVAPLVSAAGWSVSPPTSFTFSATGTRTAYAWSKDTAGNVSASRSATVTITVPDTTAPSIAIVEPAVGATVGGTFTISLNAVDNVGIKKVEYYLNGIRQASDYSAPYRFSWNTNAVANGTYTLTAKAYDTANNVKTSSAVSVTVKNDPAIKVSVAGQTDKYFSNIPAALTALGTSSTETMVLREQTYAGSMTVARCGAQVLIRGGYNASFTTQTGTSAIYGSLTVSCGTTMVENLVIQ